MRNSDADFPLVAGGQGRSASDVLVSTVGLGLAMFLCSLVAAGAIAFHYFAK
jgi:hypothetical protein